MNLISIIIPAHNCSNQIRKCLNSVLKQDEENYEIIIVDNGSKDQTPVILKKEYPQILLIENPDNYGFSKALNQGINKATGKYVLCLNDDVILKDKFLSSLQSAIETSDDIAAIQPKVLKKDEKTIDTTGIALTFLRRFYDIGSGKLDNAEFNKQRYIFGACAAAVLYRKDALESVKYKDEYFDEDFFCIAEDVDISWRLQRKGWRTLFYPDAVCTHLGGISRSNNKDTVYLSLRNRYLMILKNESPEGLIRFLGVFFLYDIWRDLYRLIYSPKLFLKSMAQTANLIPKMLKKRAL
ncbi:MAG: glycosyltransferase family 2 protein [Candidatus Omnitrophica bacterium]|jgi:GT2 family glycosyltransferase|nr:glycosyltransferase family 2 protein [Candidatus Omnitrophota bacterium]